MGVSPKRLTQPTNPCIPCCKVPDDDCPTNGYESESGKFTGTTSSEGVWDNSQAVQCNSMTRVFKTPPYAKQTATGLPLYAYSTIAETTCQQLYGMPPIPDMTGAHIRPHAERNRLEDVHLTCCLGGELELGCALTAECHAACPHSAPHQQTASSPVQQPTAHHNPYTATWGATHATDQGPTPTS